MCFRFSFARVVKQLTCPAIAAAETIGTIEDSGFPARTRTHSQETPARNCKPGTAVDLFSMRVHPA
jgi:hypothetical protein